MNVKAGMPKVGKPTLGEVKPTVSSAYILKDVGQQREFWEMRVAMSGYDVEYTLELMSGAFAELAEIDMGTSPTRIVYALGILMAWVSILIAVMCKGADDDADDDADKG